MEKMIEQWQKEESRKMERGRAWDNSSKSRGKGEEVVDGCHGTGRGASAYIDVRSEIVQKDSPSSH